MKRAFCLSILLLLIVNPLKVHGQIVLFSEDFESNEIPLNWKEEFVKGSIRWRYENGGYSTTPWIPNSRQPVKAHDGEFNALFQYQSMNSEATKLVTKKISALEFAIKPELHFFHAQFDWNHGTEEEPITYHDNLRVYYKSSASAPWTLLRTYTEATTDWVERIILLPENDLSPDYYLAFEGETKWGWGTCVDDIKIIETGILPKYLDNIAIEQASDISIASGTVNNPILRLKLKVMGNSGSCPLNSLILNSLNTSDNDIEPSGVKLFFTEDETFSTDNQISVGVNFVSDQAVFTGLNYDLPTGYSYIWVTYDVKQTAGHRDTLDAKINANNININGKTFLSENASPSGSRIILQTLYSDDFESDLEWTLSGEWEHGTPMKLGGSQGNSDPETAYSGSKIIGTDLSGQGSFPGDYEKNLISRGYKAISDTFDFTYYTDLSIRYRRWLNIGVNDEVFVDVSPDSGVTWQNAWYNSTMILDESWKLHEIDITSQAARKDNVLIRYSLGTTNDYWQLSGWNIDDFEITGQYVSKDVGISSIVSPIDGCGHSSTQSVIVMITNFGAADSYGVIPLEYSFDGNVTIIRDTLYQVIPFGESVQFTFKKKADLSVAGIYNFIAATDMGGDDDTSNDAIETTLYVQPTIENDYLETFESNAGLWIIRDYRNSTWECGSPGYGIIPSSGSNVWMTGLTNYYLNNDSSFVESVCYKSGNGIRKVLQLDYWSGTEIDKDGTSIQFSVDNGANWQLLDTLIADWDWYSGNVEALNTEGWSGDSEGWKTVKLILPKAISNEPSVKFRMAFASDDQNTGIGYAIDNFHVFNAPQDIGVTGIDSYTDACQFVNPDLITVNVMNLGINSLRQNDTILVGYDLNQELIAVDTIKLVEDLSPGQTAKFTLGMPVDITLPGIYNITAYTLIEDDPYYYSDISNDTASVEFEVFQNPFTMMPDTIQTRMPDTVMIATINDVTYDYFWNGIPGTYEYNVEDPGWYYLTVTATGGNGCSSYDSCYVELLFNDVGIDSMIHPVDHCGLTAQEYPVARVRNFGTDSIPAGNKIAVVYSMNGGTPVSDTLRLSNTLYSGHSINFAFTKGPVDLVSAGLYNFKLYTSFTGDTIPENDTISASIEILGRPVVNIGPDQTFEALTHTLDAGPGFTGYLWDDESTGQTREITESGSYWVRVLDDNLCDNTDTAKIMLKIRDIKVTSLDNPVSDCRLDAAEPIRMSIQNAGNDTLKNGTVINVSFHNQPDPKIDASVTLTGTLLPGSTLIHTFAETLDLSAQADYLLEVTATVAGDLRRSNDTLKTTVYRYAKPVVNFGLQEIEYIDAAELFLDAGESLNYSYLWQDESTESSYTVTDNGTYWAVATDTRTACYDRDTVKVIFIYSDVGITWSDMPVSSCSSESFKNVVVRVKNQGLSYIGKDYPIFVACDINGTRVTIDTLVRSAMFSPGTSLDLTLSGTISVPGEDLSKIAFYTICADDEQTENDSLWLEFQPKDAPVVDFGDEDGELTTTLPHMLDAGAGHKTYYWQDGSTAQTFNVTQTGTFAVTVTGQNDCQTTKSVIIKLMDGIIDFTGDPGNILIYPNPNYGLFNISLDDKENSDLTLTIINNQGQTVYVRELKASDPDWEKIDVQHLQSGVYHVLIISEEQSFRGKMVIR